VSMAIMVHTAGGKGISCSEGSNGSVTKTAVFRGKSAHAGGSPHAGINALYAATTALSAANALRETFRDRDHIRFHPILTKAGAAVNAIPDEVVSESYVRAATMQSAKEISDKMNRAYAGAAAAMGCTVEFIDEHGYAPRMNDFWLQEAFRKVGSCFFSEEEMRFHNGWGTGCSDMGDVGCVMPAVHPHIGGAVGSGHGNNYYISNPVLACVTSAKVQAGVLAVLLSENAAYAKKVLAESKVPYPSKEAFFKALSEIEFRGEGVTYEKDGTVTLCFKNKVKN